MERQSNDEHLDGAELDRFSINQVVAVLDRPVRQEILEYLARETKREADLDELVDYLSGKDHRAPASGERIALRLHHVHLPKLADTGVIEYNPDERRIRYQGDTSVERILDVLKETD